MVDTGIFVLLPLTALIISISDFSCHAFVPSLCFVGKDRELSACIFVIISIYFVAPPPTHTILKGWIAELCSAVLQVDSTWF